MHGLTVSSLNWNLRLIKLKKADEQKNKLSLSLNLITGLLLSL
jgi:hypothetical protein